MAGAGYKLFATGDVLTAAQVNTYLMQQTVMVFASSAARTTALSGVLAEGMVSYLQDTNSLEVYDGSAWIGATGDITALTAGTGISISSATGPIPTVAIDSTVATLTGSQTLTNKTLTAPVISTIENTGTLTLPTSTDTLVGRATTDTLTNKTLTSPVLTTPSISNIDAKGDLLAGTADNTIGRLAVGTNGQVLTADSAEATGLKWAASSSGALTLIHTETLSGVSAVNIDSKFTSTYVNYLVVANIEQSTSNSMTIQYRAAGSTISSGYKTTFWYTEYTNNTWNVTSSSSASQLWSVSSSTDRNLMSLIIGDPQTSEFTKAQSLTTDNTYNVGYNSVYPQTTSIDGLRFSVNTGNMTGTIRIYGYQNS